MRLPIRGCKLAINFHMLTDNITRGKKMSAHRVRTAKKLKPLEITYAYAEYKTRRECDFDSDLANWTNNILNLMKAQKMKK